jgi:hypothetical protein
LGFSAGWLHGVASRHQLTFGYSTRSEIKRTQTAQTDMINYRQF